MSGMGQAVFLSYASQDAAAARRICEALRAAGIEVWFDQNELVGGDAWDQKIRKQIRECALFVPVISAGTQARREGYFRLEWKLADDRTHLMAKGTPFVLPVCIDDTSDRDAMVPDSFLAVQWMRLPGGEAGDPFAARVRALLDGSAVGVGGAARSDPEANDGVSRLAHHVPPGSVARRRGGWALAAVGAVLVVAVVAFLKWRGDRPAGASAGTTADAAVKAEPRSEARELMAKARKLSLDKYNSSADDFATAEGLLKRALELDQNDPAIWAVSSLFNTAIRSRGFDHSPSRREQARRDAERALKLAPDSVEALFALGRVQRDGDRAAAEVTFKRVLELDPNYVGALTGLASVYDYSHRPEAAAALYERALKVAPEVAPLTRYTQFLLYFHYGRFAEAERSIRESIALEPSANSQAGLAMLLLTWKGDADQAAQAVAAPSAPEQPRIVWVSATVHLCRRAPEDMMRVLGRLTDEYVQDNWFAGPKGYFVGWAHTLAGRHEAARIAWQSALSIVDVRLKTKPDSLDLRLARGQLLGWLGQVEEARREARIVQELELRPDIWVNSPALIHAAIGDAEAALPQLRELLNYDPRKHAGWPFTPALLRLDPRWDKVRADPRVQALIDAKTAAATEDTRGNATAAPDFPRDPELRRARDLIYSLDAIPEDFALAEDIVKAVQAKRPTDPEVVTVQAEVAVETRLRGFDVSAARSAQALRLAERAVQLAPDRPEAQSVLGRYLATVSTQAPRAESALRRAIELEPGEPRHWRALLRVVLAARPQDGEALAARLVEQFPRDPLTRYDVARYFKDTGRVEEMERGLDEALALAPITSALVWKSWLALEVHGDVAAAKAWADRVPSRQRINSRVAHLFGVIGQVTGDTAEALKLLNEVPETWLTDFDFTGPKALIIGDLLARDGRAELARIQYEAALAEIQREKARTPTDLRPRRAELAALLGLERMDEARDVQRMLMQSLTRPYRVTINTSWWNGPIRSSLRLGARADALALLREATAEPGGRRSIRNCFRLDPRMSELRNDREIVALLAEPGR